MENLDVVSAAFFCAMSLPESAQVALKYKELPKAS